MCANPSNKGRTKWVPLSVPSACLFLYFSHPFLSVLSSQRHPASVFAVPPWSTRCLLKSWATSCRVAPEAATWPGTTAAARRQRTRELSNCCSSLALRASRYRGVHTRGPEAVRRNVFIGCGCLRNKLFGQQGTATELGRSDRNKLGKRKEKPPKPQPDMVSLLWSALCIKSLIFKRNTFKPLGTNSSCGRERMLYFATSLGSFEPIPASCSSQWFIFCHFMRIFRLSSKDRMYFAQTYLVLSCYLWSNLQGIKNFLKFLSFAWPKLCVVARQRSVFSQQCRRTWVKVVHGICPDSAHCVR